MKQFPFALDFSISLLLIVLLVACRPTPGKPSLPTTTGQLESSIAVTPPTFRATDQGQTVSTAHPTLLDLWEGRAEFVVDVLTTGLPMGESDTLTAPDGQLWSYLHASERSAGTIDQCGAPVDFPGCVVIYQSEDGITFHHEQPPVCQIACTQCPCTAEDDHIIQQQYPRVLEDNGRWWMVYEFQGRVMLRKSSDGLTWSPPTWVAESLIWHLWYANCPAEERIGEHPNTPFNYECLRGGPPGLAIADGFLYVFMAQGQNPGAMGCFRRAISDENGDFVACQANPLFVGAAEYGPATEDATANIHFDFRTISSAEVMPIGNGADRRFYMLYEGVRGPGPGDPGDTQFGLGLARTMTDQIDGPWEKFPGNPILVNLPGNIGLGHADVVLLDGVTVLYTSLDGETRSRLRLVWR